MGVRDAVALRAIAVDLTPVLAGGENGGAKVFALELVQRLAALAPATRFTLLTQAASHEELRTLDAENVERLLVVGATTSRARSRAFDIASRVLAPMPAVVRRGAARVGHRVHHAMKRSGAAPLRRLEVDLLFCPFTAPTFRALGIPTVSTVYDLQYREYPQFFAPEDAALREAAFRDACRHATALAAISDFTRAAAIEHGRLDPERIRTIHLRVRAPAGGSATASRGRYLLYPANFWRHKNHEMLLAAFAMAANDGLPPDLRLVLTGAPGERKAWLERAAARLGLGERVDFPGFVAETELEGLMRGATAVVYPSLYEGFGLPLVEAMARGVPVACSNRAALPEIAGGAALLFDPRVPEEIAGALRMVVADEAARSRLVEAGRRRAAAFTDPDAMAREYWTLFESAGARAALP